MGQIHDRAREERWREKGNRRLSARISWRSWVLLRLLAEAYGITRREVIEGLLFGVILPEAVSREVWARANRRATDPPRLRLTMRITRRAATELERIEAQYGCARCDAVDGLLLGTIAPHQCAAQRQAVTP